MRNQALALKSQRSPHRRLQPVVHGRLSPSAISLVGGGGSMHILMQPMIDFRVRLTGDLFGLDLLTRRRTVALE